MFVQYKRHLRAPSTRGNVLSVNYAESSFHAEMLTVLQFKLISCLGSLPVQAVEQSRKLVELFDVAIAAKGAAYVLTIRTCREFLLGANSEV